MPCPSATTGFRAKAMPPRDWQLPRWMCETWDEMACRPWIFSSMVVVLAVAVSSIVPPAVTPGSGVSRKVIGVAEGAALGEACTTGVGDGEPVAAPPHPAMKTAIAAITPHNLGTTAAGYWSGLGVQPSPRGLSLGRVSRLGCAPAV